MHTRKQQLIETIDNTQQALSVAPAEDVRSLHIAIDEAEHELEIIEQHEQDMAAYNRDRYGSGN